MLIYSMSVSVDGFIADRDGAFGWSVPSEEQFRFHLEQVRGLGGCLLGRRLYETMLVWETDPSLRDNEDTDAFADVWCALPKVVFSRTLDRVQGNARLAEAPLAEEVAAALAATDKDHGPASDASAHRQLVTESTTPSSITLIIRRAYGFHTAKAALALVMLTCGPITLRLPHQLHLTSSP